MRGPRDKGDALLPVRLQLLAIYIGVLTALDAMLYAVGLSSPGPHVGQWLTRALVWGPP